MKKLTLLMILTLLTACNPTKNPVRSNTATISGVEVGSQCQGVATAQQYGKIYDSTFTSSDFGNRVKALLSATIRPEEVGLVSGAENDSTGVRFTGRIKIDGNGNVISEQSSLTVSVYDSIWLQNRMTNPNEQEIRITFDPAAGRGATITGQFNTSSGQGSITLRDNYGTIVFTGTMDAQRLSGTVQFQNSANVSGGAGYSGSLGQFAIQRCGFVQ